LRSALSEQLRVPGCVGRSVPLGRLLLLPLLLCASLLPGGASAQNLTEPLGTAFAPSVPDTLGLQITPGDAFVRALLLPGWGHASIGEYTRGGFYFLTEVAAGWMMARTLSRLSAAKGVRDMRRVDALAAMTAQGVTDPRLVSAAVAADPLVVAAGDLVEARSQQFEDWLALGAFLVFLSGIDAFVSAHLRDFPEPVRFDLGQSGLSVGLSLPLSGAHPGR